MVITKFVLSIQGFVEWLVRTQLTGYNVPSQLLTRFYFCTNYKQFNISWY